VSVHLLRSETVYSYVDGDSFAVKTGKIVYTLFKFIKMYWSSVCCQNQTVDFMDLDVSYFIKKLEKVTDAMHCNLRPPDIVQVILTLIMRPIA